MIDYYTIDAQHIYIGAVQIDPYAPLPPGTTTPPQTDAAISAVERWIANDLGIAPWW